MHFLRVNVAFYDAVKVIHDVITTNQIPYSAKAYFSEVEIIKLKNQTLKDK